MMAWNICGSTRRCVVSSTRLMRWRSSRACCDSTFALIGLKHKLVCDTGGVKGLMEGVPSPEGGQQQGEHRQDHHDPDPDGRPPTRSLAEVAREKVLVVLVAHLDVGEIERSRLDFVVIRPARSLVAATLRTGERTRRHDGAAVGAGSAAGTAASRSGRVFHLPHPPRVESYHPRIIAAAPPTVSGAIPTLSRPKGAFMRPLPLAMLCLAVGIVSSARVARADAIGDAVDVSQYDIQNLIPRAQRGSLVTPIVLDGRTYLMELTPHSYRADDFKLLVQRPDGSFERVEPPAPETIRAHLVGQPGTRVG